jgi:hypothetical protein
MSNVINGTKLSNGNFMIELNAEQMDDLATFYLMRSAKFLNKQIESDSQYDKELYLRISDSDYDTYKAIKKIEGKEF